MLKHFTHLVRGQISFHYLVLFFYYLALYSRHPEIYFHFHCHMLKDTHREKHPKIKLQRFQKIRIWTFVSLVHQINSFEEVLKLKQIFQKDKVVTGKTPRFMIGPFCSRHSICLNIGF